MPVRETGNARGSGAVMRGRKDGWQAGRQAGRPLSRITRSVTRGRGVPGEKINGLRALCVNVIRFPCTREPSPRARRPTYLQCDITRSSAGNTVRSAGRSRFGPITNFHYSKLIPGSSGRPPLTAEPPAVAWSVAMRRCSRKNREPPRFCS